MHEILINRSDTVGEPVSALESQPFHLGISMVLCLQRSQTRGAIFEASEFANSIRSFSESGHKCLCGNG
jgi:hypothetical protein